METVARKQDGEAERCLGGSGWNLDDNCG